MKTLTSEHIAKIMIRTTNWLGDAVMTTPAMAQIRASFPEAEIVVIANPLVAQLFTCHPDCDRVLIFDKRSKDRGITGFLRFSQQLRREQFDLALLFQNAIEGALMAFLAGIPRRGGYPTDGRMLLINYRSPMTTATKELHHTDYYLQMLAGLGLEGSRPPLRLASTEMELQQAHEILGGGRWIAINPGASYGSAKRWFPERFAAVADQLAEKHQARIVLIGGPGEQQIGHDIAIKMEQPVLNLIGKTSVRDMIAAISCCSLIITNDSGPMHVAAAVGTPIVAIFGPTDHTTTSPLTTDFTLIRKPTPCAPCLLRQCPKDHQCMTAITADEVFAAADAMLGAR
ncbi:MAG: lipopolysaccharide heptosyltransferase II [Deltaproteobacteria bacterium]|nr:lipopolysaccharide heptosyltransferase II [Candidatus Anaeroferrophillus wilburensis]MBN2889047.1 lipopolysaccharide heptosyltransferase II [Deltaproteobacteria bacterium]